MRRNVVQWPAPSTLAASYSSVGMLCRPASEMSIIAPIPHRPMTPSDGSTQNGSCSQSGPVTPNQRQDPVHPAGLGVEDAGPDQGARDERDLGRHVEQRPEPASPEQARRVQQDGQPDGQGDRGRDGDHREPQRDPDGLPDVRVAEQPDVVVEADELHLVGPAQVEVGEAEVEGQRHRDHREQDEPDDPRRDEGVAPGGFAPGRRPSPAWLRDGRLGQR